MQTKFYAKSLLHYWAFYVSFDFQPTINLTDFFNKMSTTLDHWWCEWLLLNWLWCWYFTHFSFLNMCISLLFLLHHVGLKSFNRSIHLALARIGEVCLPRLVWHCKRVSLCWQKWSNLFERYPEIGLKACWCAWDYLEFMVQYVYRFSWFCICTSFDLQPQTIQECKCV